MFFQLAVMGFHTSQTCVAKGTRGRRRVGREKGMGKGKLYFVAAGLVTDILNIAVDVVHGVGLGGDVLLRGAGGGFVEGCVGHIVDTCI